MEEAPALVRRARAGAQLSVRALAQRADVSTSTIVRIEQGQVDPTLGMLRKVLAAAGQDLEITTTGRSSGATSSPAPRRPRVRLADLATAWKAASHGDSPDWTRFRGTLDHLSLHPDAVAGAIQQRPSPSGSVMIDALLADDADRPRPAWTKHVPSLDQEWAMPGTPKMIACRRRATPTQLRARGLVLDEASLWRHRGDG